MPVWISYLFQDLFELKLERWEIFFGRTFTYISQDVFGKDGGFGIVFCWSFWVGRRQVGKDIVGWTFITRSFRVWRLWYLKLEFLFGHSLAHFLVFSLASVFHRSTFTFWSFLLTEVLAQNFKADGLSLADFLVYSLLFAKTKTKQSNLVQEKQQLQHLFIVENCQVKQKIHE